MDDYLRVKRGPQAYLMQIKVVGLGGAQAEYSAIGVSGRTQGRRGAASTCPQFNPAGRRTRQIGKAVARGCSVQEVLAMKLRTADGGWSPYLAGALLGLLAILSVYATTELLGKTSYLGASTSFVRVAGLVEQQVAPEHVAANVYFSKEKVRVDWQMMLVGGIFLGALLGALSDKSFKLESVPPIWKERFGPSVGRRAAAAVFGGVLAMFGARLADGCPSGHGLSGMMQLSVSSLVALALFFIVGVLVAALLYGRR